MTFIPQLTYLTESKEWSIHWDGIHITSDLDNQHLLTSQVAYDPKICLSPLVHFGSEYVKQPLLMPWSKKIVSVFHLEQNVIDNPPARFLKLLSDADVIHSSCMSTKKQLNTMRLPTPIYVIPLGVDTSLFTQKPNRYRLASRKELGIPENAFVIGSFQKDGVGWGDGLEPKMVKGPDVLVEVIKEVNKSQPVHALLSGPSRGYVMAALKRHNIPHTWKLFDDYLKLPEYLGLCDVCLITSRVEGGPKQALEASSMGIPVVSTKVGMVADHFVDGTHAFIREVGDVDGLTEAVIMLAEDRKLRTQLGSQAQAMVQQFDWSLVAKQYYETLYKPLLD